MYFPDEGTVQIGVVDLEYVIPAAAFHILGILSETDQLQTAEIEGREGMLDAGLKENLGIPNASKIEGAADHGAIVCHRMTSL
jgi:hypothetical protein